MSIYKGSVLVSGKGVIEIDSALSATSRNPVQNNVITSALNMKSDKNDIIAISPNLLINPNFKINQRGKTRYTTEGYTVDCWKLKKHPSVSTSGSVAVNDDYVTLTSGGTRLDTYFLQLIENASTELAGKQVTISFKVAGDVGDSWYVGQYEGSYVTLENASIDENGIGHVSITWDGSKSVQAISFFNNQQSASVDIYWVKLEVGDSSTMFIAPDSSQELLKCQSFYMIIPTGRYTRATFVGTNIVFFLLSLPVAMKKTPSIVSGTMGVIPLNQSTSSQADTSFDFTITGVKNNSLTIQASKTNGAIDGALYVTETLILSAEL